jgi:DNA gyrase subunit A
MTTKEEDIVDHLVCSRTHDDIYFFTNKGRVFASKVYELPATSRQSKGTPVVNIIQISQDEKVTSILTVPKSDDKNQFFIMGTVQGQIKKTEIEKYENIRKTGIIAIGLKGRDELKWVKTANSTDVVVEVSEKGQAICYFESDVRPMGRSASGVTGMRLRSGDKVMAMDVVPGYVWPDENKKKSLTEPDMLIVLENGFGKRTMLRNFHIQKRGGMGIRAASCTPKTGNVIGMHIVYDEKGDVVLASRKGQFIRMELKKIKRLGRDTQGVTLMRLKESDKVSSVALILADDTDISDDNQNQLPLDGAPTDNAEKKIETTIELVDESDNVAMPVKNIKNTEIVSKKPITKKETEKISKQINTFSKPSINVKFYNDSVKVNKETKN